MAVRLFGLGGDSQDYFLVDFTRALLSHTKHVDFAVQTHDVRLVARVKRGVTKFGMASPTFADKTVQ